MSLVTVSRNLPRTDRFRFFSGLMILSLAVSPSEGQVVNSVPARAPVVAIQQTIALAAQLDTPAVPPTTLRPDSNTVVDLTLTKGRFGFPSAAQIDPTVPAQYDLLCYGNAPVGPTIRVKRGQKLKIKLTNSVHGPVDPGNDPLDGNNPWEVPHGMCTTNLHTHGLHVSPAGSADNVFLHVEPGTDFSYEYQIPANHPAGTFWYHPHKHGSTAYQASNGVAGAIIVEGNPNDAIKDLDDIPEIAKAQEQILMLQYYTFGTYNDATGKTVGFIDPAKIYNVNPRNNLLSCDCIAPAGQVNANAGSAVLAVNGQLLPRFNAAPGEVQRWRFIHGGWDIPQYLGWFQEDGITPAPELLMYEIALDGLPTGSLSQVSPMLIAPGQRSDLLLKMPTLKPNTQKTYYLMRLNYEGAVGAVGVPAKTAVAKLVVGGTAKAMALPSTTALAACRPFTPIANSELVPPTIPNGELVFAGDDPPNPPSLAGAVFTINGLTFHQQQPIRLTVGTAQQWKITSAVLPNNNLTFGGHPFHIHVNPFQVISYTDPKGVTTPMNVWRDTLFVPVGASYTIRSRFQDLTGLSVLHCHVLDHEDQGMMMPIKFVVPGQASLTDGDPAAALVRADFPAPTLKLGDVQEAAFNLADFRGRPVILVFFKGIRCGPCVQDLRNLVREARANSEEKVEIVAVSDRKITDLAKALEYLDVTEADRFHLLVDEEHAAFADYGCGTGADARHGLFVIDEAGMVRSRYIGETPYGDCEDVFDRIRMIAGMPPIKIGKESEGASSGRTGGTRAATVGFSPAGSAKAAPALSE